MVAAGAGQLYRLGEKMRTEEFYSFMRSRELVRLARLRGESWPWTEDEILQKYSFTNVKREHDRTTQFLWRRLRQHEDSPAEEILMNCAAFRYFGNMGFAEAHGWIEPWGTGKEVIRAVALERQEAGLGVFSNAYITSPGPHPGPKRNTVIDKVLDPLHERAPEIVQVARETQSWEQVARIMQSLAGFGGSGFMVKEVLQDAMSTKILRDCVDRNIWCPVGPGAKRGANRVMAQPHDAPLSAGAGLGVMLKLFAAREEHWPDSWVGLELHDIQFQLCEFDKYERVRTGTGGRVRQYRRSQ